MRAESRDRVSRLLSAAVAAALIVGAAAAAPGADPARAAAAGPEATTVAESEPPANGLRTFASCQRFRDYVRNQTTRLRRTGYWGPFTPTGGREEGDAALSADAGSPRSPTNVQEPGVDEPDIVKTAGPDGSVILAIDGDRLRAVDASSPAPVELGSLKLPTGPGKRTRLRGTELLVHGDRALVIANASGRNGVWEGWWAPRTVINEVDISDPAAMRAVRTEAVEGSYRSARLTGATARVVVTDYAELPGPLPVTFLNDRIAGERTTGRLHPCREIHRPRHFSGLGTASVLTVDLEQGLPATDADTVIGGGEIVYGSPTGLYVATERWLRPSGANRFPKLRTRIHRFDADDPRATEYASTGSVRGYMLSQWSMSEHEGDLRVATTTRPPWTGPRLPSRSLVTVLREDGQRMEQVGRVGGLGKGERIFAVRFVGEHGYVVTFREIDPLYTLDLSDPTDPRVLGELKMPGYSAYLHPIGDDHMLGIGRHATRTGRLRGAKASLFDLTDLGDPRRFGQERLGGRRSWSPVERDHRALHYAEDRELAVVPVREGFRRDRFVGVALLRVAATGIEPLGQIEHTPRQPRPIERSLIAADRLYTVSSRGIAAHDPDTFERLGWTAFD